MSQSGTTTPSINTKDIVEILGAVISPSEPPKPIPGDLILAGSEIRNGLSPRKITSRILARLPSVGAYTGILPDGSQNVNDLTIGIIVEELINAFMTEGIINIVIPPGVTVVVTSPTGPLPGATIVNANGKGIIR